jgi:hypothetical protein
MIETQRADTRKSAKRIGRLVEQVSRIPEGRELLAELDEFCGHGKCVFNPQSERQNNFNQGKQAVIAWLHDKHEKYKGEMNDED